jgi:tripartite-type tricarboxylate transporter receptor subunit TctC
MMRIAVPLLFPLLSMLATPALAQGFPSKPIRLVVPYGAGGASDVLARALAFKASEGLGQQVVVENRTGAGGVVAAELVKAAAPDGYTLFVADTGPLAIVPALQAKVSYDPVKDFTPVILAASAPFFLAVGSAHPVQSVAQLVQYAKAKPRLPYGSSGNGSGNHLTMEQLKLVAGIDLTHVPYKGNAQSVPALVSGDIALLFVGLASISPHLKSGKARVIAVATPKRSPQMPDVPAVAETYPGFEMNLTIGIVGPAGMPREVVSRLNAEFAKALASPETAQRLPALGIDPIAGSAEVYAEQIRADLPRLRKLVKDTGATVD